MTATAGRTRDDRVLAYTRIVSLLIVPFLLAAFVVLYLFPTDTKRLFAWTIRSTMTAMTLGSAYLGGAYFFLRVQWEKRWHVVKTGFLAVALFATLLGVTTIVHWDQFNHGHVAFWLWAGLYFVAPFLVTAAWLANGRVAAPPGAGEQRIGRSTRWAVGVVGLLAIAQGMVLVLIPHWAIAIWPWPLTPLTCRVVGSIFCLGSAGLAVLVDPRWTTLKLMVEVECLMLALILIAAVRARTELDIHRPLTWLLLAGFLTVLTGSAFLWHHRQTRPRPGMAVRSAAAKTGGH